jgi:hypothetical protein
MSVRTSSVRIRKASIMIVQSAPPLLPLSLAAQPAVYGPLPAVAHIECGLSNRPNATPDHFHPRPRPAHDLTTDHAGLVVLGKYAQQLGLIERLQTVPLAQRTRTHTPQAKLIQFFVGILAGLDYLQDFNLAPQPLVTDPAVAASWQQDTFAHYSGVSRTLAAADDATLTAVQRVLQEVSRPFIEREVLALVCAGHPLVIDVDLTGRPVSPTSTTYPDADFGWMDDAVAKGYQAAITTLSGGPSGRLVLSSQRYPGRTKSAECLRAAVRQMEQVLGLHPRRRPDLVRQRLAALAPQLQQRQAVVDKARQRLEHLHLTAERVEAELGQVRGTAADREARGSISRAPLDRPPHVGQWRLSRLQQQAERLPAQVQAAVDWCQKQEAHLRGLQEQAQQLATRLVELERDNAALVTPVRVLLRVDAGFSTGDNLAWLIEAGYGVVTKAHSGHTTTRLRRTVRLNAVWTVVGGNADAVHLPAQHLNDCPYAVEVLLVRYQLPAGQRWTALLYYDETPPPTCLSLWFDLYNARQIMEAGIKEQKAVFTMRRPLVRSRVGLQLQELFSVFAANFVRWAAQWAREQAVQQATRRLQQALTETKTLVRVVGRTRARLIQRDGGCALVFDMEGPFAGSVLVFAGQVAYQEVLPLFRAGGSVPDEVT